MTVAHIDGADPYVWAKEYIRQLNEKEKKQTRKILVPFEQSDMITKNEQRSFNGGYIFLPLPFHVNGPILSYYEKTSWKHVIK